MKEKLLLARYLPDSAVDKAYQLIVDNSIHLKISKERRSKLGDYRPPIQHTNHRISVNHNLNKYAFLVTFIHEVAHLLVFEKYKSRVEPHGREWKQEYRILMLSFIESNIFPKEIEKVLLKSIVNSKASSSSDIKLSRVLKNYDEKDGQTSLEDLHEGAIFVIDGGRRFQKGEKQRTRFKCKSIDNNKWYFVHALAPVIELKMD